MKNLKKRTFLLLLAGLTATVFASAQKQPLPEWQSQYAVGLNKLTPHTFIGVFVFYHHIFIISQGALKYNGITKLL